MLKIIECKKNYVNEFIRSYKGWTKSHGKTLDIHDDDLLIYFIEKHALNQDSYIRFQRKNENCKGYNQIERKKVICELKDDIRYWLESDDTDYDTWHKLTCEKFVNNFNEKVNNGQYQPICFGTGQKVVNMTMKYLSSCDNAKDYEKRFSDCHMPLDSRILENFYYVYAEKNIPKNQHKKWTKLSYEDYAEITGKIREFYKKSGRNPFAEEWEIWNRISRGCDPITAKSLDKVYNFYGWEKVCAVPVNKEYPSVDSPYDLYDFLSEIWSADTCAPRMRDSWSANNKTLGQCSITAFLVQDIFGGKVYGILRNGGNYHCYNVIGDCVFDLTSEQFGDEKLIYENNPEQFREVHFAKEEKRLRYEFLKKSLKEKITENNKFIKENL